MVMSEVAKPGEYKDYNLMDPYASPILDEAIKYSARSAEQEH